MSALDLCSDIILGICTAVVDSVFCCFLVFNQSANDHHDINNFESQGLLMSQSSHDVRSSSATPLLVSKTPTSPIDIPNPERSCHFKYKNDIMRENPWLLKEKKEVQDEYIQKYGY
ncbi:MAG: hypothetical protein O3C05_02505 [Proteobacteria bacterium]|nr:hypothetical protein [Pseudomonadota bacterium]